MLEELKQQVYEANLELPKNKNELMGIIALGLIDDIQKIEEFVENGKKAGYLFRNGEAISVVKSEVELQKYLQQKIEKLKEKSHDDQLWEKFMAKIQLLKLDSKGNEEYRNAFETMTGIGIQAEHNFEEVTKAEEYSILDRAIEVTEETTRVGTINEQIRTIEEKERQEKSEPIAEH